MALAPWLLLDVGNTAIKWRLADEHGLLESGGVAADLSVLREALRGVAWQAAAAKTQASNNKKVKKQKGKQQASSPSKHKRDRVGRYPPPSHTPRCKVFNSRE